MKRNSFGFGSRSIALAASFMATGALLAGCPRPPVARPYPPPSATELLAQVSKQSQRAGTLRSEARVDYRGDKGERVKVHMTFVASPPGALRAEAESPFGGVVASLATDGQQFELLDTRANRFLAGAASPCNIARLIRVVLSPADVVAVLAGSAPDFPDATSSDVSWDAAGGNEVLTLRRASGESEIIRFDARDRRWDVTGVTLRDAQGALRWQLTNSDFADAGGGVRLPDHTDIVQPSTHADVRLRFKSREPNASVPATAFHLDAPSGLAVETVGCDG